MFLWDVI